MRVFRRTIWTLITLALLAYPATVAGIYGFAMLYEPAEIPDDAMIVVLSSGQKKNGEMGRQTAIRMKAGIAIFDPGDAMLVTGNVGTDPVKPVAVAMAEFAQAAGITAITEPHARSTYQNAIKSAEILETLPDRPIILVTNRFHLPRSWLLFRNAGVDEITLYPAETARQHRKRFSLRTYAKEALKMFDAFRVSILDGL